MAIDDRVLDLLQKMQAKEASLREIGTEAAINEAANAAAKIAELCLKHKIDMTEVERRDYKAANDIGREVYQYDGTETYRARNKQGWEVGLADCVARAHDCRALVGTGYLVFVGRAPDRAVAVAVFRTLRRELTEACTMGYRQARKGGLETRGFIASFFAASVSTIQTRYRAMKDGLVSATLSQALVVQVDAELQAFLDGIGIKRGRTVAQRGSFSPLGYKQGLEFGKSVDLGTEPALEGAAE